MGCCRRRRPPSMPARLWPRERPAARMLPFLHHHGHGHRAHCRHLPSPPSSAITAVVAVSPSLWDARQPARNLTTKERNHKPARLLSTPGHPWPRPTTPTLPAHPSSTPTHPWPLGQHAGRTSPLAHRYQPHVAAGIARYPHVAARPRIFAIPMTRVLLRAKVPSRAKAFPQEPFHQGQTRIAAERASRPIAGHLAPLHQGQLRDIWRHFIKAEHSPSIRAFASRTNAHQGQLRDIRCQGRWTKAVHKVGYNVILTVTSGVISSRPNSVHPSELLHQGRTRIKVNRGTSGAISSRPNPVHPWPNAGHLGPFHQGRTHSIQAFPSRPTHAASVFALSKIHAASVVTSHPGRVSRFRLCASIATPCSCCPIHAR